MIRDTEDRKIIAARWACSMYGRGQAAKRSDDTAAKAARDAANQKGADAWSPSRAREVLRKFRGPRHSPMEEIAPLWIDESQAILKAAERLNAYADNESFRLFCLDRGIPLTVT